MNSQTGFRSSHRSTSSRILYGNERRTVPAAVDLREQQMFNSSYDSNANSSDADRSGYVGNHPNVVLGYKGDYGVQTRMIGFYHKSGDIGDRDYYSFKKSVRKAQRDWQIRTNSN